MEGVLSNLHEAVSNCSPGIVDQVVRQNPGAVNQKGWNGLTPLHKACLRGVYYIVKILLDFNADPNLRNNSEETPFMFACKRGNPAVMQALLDKGADLGAVDNLGRGAMHHAAHGGSVYSLHFLHEVCGAPFDWFDKMKQTPLMIVSMHGHLEALKYLLKKDRVNVHNVDANGNSALHIAAVQGHIQVSWSLLLIGKVKMVHVQNKEGATPVDLACKTKDVKHKETADLLKYLSLFPDTNYQPQGPSIAWFWHMLMPSVLYVLAFGLSKMCGQYMYGEGVVMTVCLLYIIYTILKHQHRIEHVSRWPNPVYAGCFAGGFLGSTACFYWQVMPVISEHIFLIGSLILLTPLVIFLYWRLLRVEPGSVCRSAMKEDGSYYSIKDIASAQLPVETFCITCEIVRPDKQAERIKHCKLCDVCMADMDHHCLYLLKCVARDNHRLFVIFISTVLLSMILLLSSIVIYFNIVCGDADSINTVMLLAFKYHVGVASVAFLNIGSVIWGCFLLQHQLKLISGGFTTVFQPMFKNGTGLTGSEKFMNVLYFFQGKKRFIKDPFYDV